MKRIIFILLAAVAFVVTSGFAGMIAHFIPSPSEFIATLIAAALMIYLTMKLCRYRAWPIAIFVVMLIMIGLSSSLIVKKMIHAKTASSAVGISVNDAADHVRKDFLSFTDSRIDFDNAGYYLLQHYGDHHYYAFPIVGEDWHKKDPVVAWTWARTRSVKNMAQQQRLIPASANYGLRVREHAILVNVQRSIEQAAQAHDLNIAEKTIILHWGTLNSSGQYWAKWVNQFLIFISIIIVSVLLQMVFAKKGNSDLSK